LDTQYQRKLIMLQGSGGLTGFVNLEAQSGKITLKFQAVGLERGAGDVHGYLVSLKKRRRLDCGRLRVDSRGQGGLLRVWQSNELEGMYVSDFDAVTVTVGGYVILSGSLSSSRVDTDALRQLFAAQRGDEARQASAERSEQHSAPEILGRMEPNISPVEAPSRRPTILMETSSARKTASPQCENDTERLIAALSEQPQEVVDAIIRALARKQTPASEEPRETARAEVYKHIDNIAPIEDAKAASPLREECDELAQTVGAVCDTAMEPMVMIAAPSTALRHSILNDLQSDSAAAYAAAEPATADAGSSTDSIADVVGEADIQIDISQQAMGRKRRAGRTHGIDEDIDPIFYTQAEDALPTVSIIDPQAASQYSAESAEPAEPAREPAREPVISPFADAPPPAQSALASDADEVWPVWSAYRKPALFWPDDAEDLRALFECGAPDESVRLAGWLFVKTPSVVEGFDSLLGVYAQDGRVLQTACVIMGDNSPDPPAGLTGYVYTEELGTGCWAQWRDYSEQFSQAE
jgi:hypothetical protein